MSNTILKTVDLKKYFKTDSGLLHAVDKVSLEIKKGETLGVVGESGCGKSTLGRAILRLLEPTSGEVFFKGENILEYGKRELQQLRSEMQMIFQDPYSSLNPRRSISDIIAKPIRIHKAYNHKSEIDAKVRKLMNIVGLSERYINSYPHELDGGRRQRIGIARAIALQPSFIVCDEPVSALDVSIQAQILNLLNNLQRDMGLTFLFITHDLSVVNYFSDHILVMYLGQVVEISDTEEIFRNPLHPYTKALLSAIPVARIENRPKRIILKGEVSTPIAPEPGCRFFPRCSYARDLCKNTEPILVEAKEGHRVYCHFVNEINEI